MILDCCTGWFRGTSYCHVLVFRHYLILWYGITWCCSFMVAFMCTSLVAVAYVCFPICYLVTWLHWFHVAFCFWSGHMCCRQSSILSICTVRFIVIYCWVLWCHILVLSPSNCCVHVVVSFCWWCLRFCCTWYRDKVFHCLTLLCILRVVCTTLV